MSVFDKFRKPRGADPVMASDDDGVSAIGQAMSENDSARKKQQLLLGGVAGIALLGASFWIFSGDKSAETATAANGKIGRAHV